MGTGRIGDWSFIYLYLHLLRYLYHPSIVLNRLTESKFKMLPRCCVRNLLELNGSNFDEEANSIVSEVIQAVTQQVIEKIAQIPPNCNHTSIVVGCTVE